VGGFDRKPGAGSLVDTEYDLGMPAINPGKQTQVGVEHGVHEDEEEPLEASDKVGSKVFKSPRFMGDPTQ
jgi:hypothetical protein